MQTFKVFLQILRKNILSVMIYVGICIILVFIVGSSNAEEGEKLYKDSEIPFTIIDRDGGQFGESIKDYLSEKNEYKEMKDDVDLLRNNLFYRNICYVLIIPEGYEESITSGENMELEHMKVKDSALGYYFDMQVDEFLRVFHSYVAAEYDIEEAITHTLQSLEENAEVTMSDKSRTEGYSTNYYYYGFLPYIIMSTIVTAVGPVYIAFNKSNIRRRINCSALRFRSRNMQLALGAVVVAGIIWLGLNLMAVVVYRGSMSQIEILFNLLNTLCMSMVALGIAFLCGNMVSSNNMLGAVINVVALGLSFLGGVFVPMEVLSDGMIKIAKITPTYWYVYANDAIVGIEKISDLDMNKVLSGFGIQILFAVAIFGTALVVIKKFRTRD